MATIRTSGRSPFGALDGDRVIVHEGDLFGDKRADRRSALALDGDHLAHALRRRPS
ncbi:MAG: hypothetical protein MZW92_64385 [Comamonadaceae bacterium]|nr:hypothetical protein [Comamonadaceae bacterium]